LKKEYGKGKHEEKEGQVMTNRKARGIRIDVQDRKKKDMRKVREERLWKLRIHSC
jgi:hypothetical protein